MRKKCKAAALILMMVLMTMVSACQNGKALREETNNAEDNQEEIATLSGTILRRTDSSILIIENKDDDSYCGLFYVGISDVTVTDSHKNTLSATDLVDGMVVNITYDGEILETDPGQIKKASKIEVKEQTGDMIGMYLRVIKDLYESSTGLNGDIQTMVLDLTEVNNLTECEKAALQYLVECNFDLEIRHGTMEDLEKEGLIKNLTYEEGILLIIKDQNPDQGQFTFEAEKWRSGTGAVGYTGYASIKNGVWEYEQKKAWVS